MAEADALNIELSLHDAEEMDAEQLLAMYEKVRQSRLHIKSERDDKATELVERENQLSKTQWQLSAALSREIELQKRLAAVAVRLVDIGTLDALTVNLKREGDK